MSDLCYCQYAFALPECRVQEIGSGVDPHFHVELIREGPIAAVTSRVGLDEFAPERLQGKTAEDLRWLGEVAARHNEIICQAAASSPVLPLRLGAVFQSRDSLQAMLVRSQASVALFLQKLGNRQEWGVKLYFKKLRLEAIPGHSGPPAPHYRASTDPLRGANSAPANERRRENVNQTPSTTSGTAYLTQKRAQRDSRRQQRATVYQTIQSVDQCLAGKAENCCRIRNLPSDLTGRADEMVFNAAYLLPSSVLSGWLETVQDIYRDVQSKGLILEVSGPWPPYHFCPTLEL
jgi:hypothetical protein